MVSFNVSSLSDIVLRSLNVLNNPTQYLRPRFPNTEVVPALVQKHLSYSERCLWHYNRVRLCTVKQEIQSGASDLD